LTRRVRYITTRGMGRAFRGQKEIARLAADDKRQITAVIGASAAGEVLPPQLIYEGKTNTAFSENHWSSEPLMEQYVSSILDPYFTNQKKRQDPPHDLPCVLILDCWCVHCSQVFSHFLQTKFTYIRTVFVPAGCTGKAQVCG
jgi:hypothetical protein